MRQRWWVRAQATERAGVIVIRDGRLAVIERCRAGRRYWVVPGGRVEPGEAVDEAARREAEEELGAAVHLGPLRVRLDRRKGDGRVQRQWYFEGTTDTDDIRVVGPELDRTADRGTYAASGSMWEPSSPSR